VWIPRYAYKIATTHTSTPCEIDVKFLIGTTDKYMKDGVETALPADYIVHPAFTFGTDKLTGIWVGKCVASNNNGNVKTYPNISIWSSIDIAHMFDACFTMATNNTYGFTGLTNGNTHMMKNIEWGAVAYLTHSKYGRNGIEVTSSNSSLLTSGGNPITNTNQSTTGNISGIYDMSGGVWKYVAGNLNFTLSRGGSAPHFDNIWNNDIERVKYFDRYNLNDNSVKGDAFYETANWFSDYNDFLGSPYPWFLRSGRMDSGNRSGIFSSTNEYGSGGPLAGFIPVFFVP
ncbi:MAG: hypothetical protein RSF67_02005, partial [Clostridia bacterium]